MPRESMQGTVKAETESPGVRIQGYWSMLWQIARELKRHLCTLEETAAALGLHLNEATKYVGELERQGRVVLEAQYGAPSEEAQ